MMRYLRRYFVDGMSAMAMGLFSSLIIGLIISQLSLLPGLGFLAAFAEVLAASSPVVGSAIAVAVAHGLGAPPLVLFSCAAVGAFSYSMGGPVGAFAATCVAVEIGGLLSGRTKADIVLTPLAVIIAGGLTGRFVGPYVSALMNMLGEFINTATDMHRFPMGILVAVAVGMALTAPISSAALCIMLGLDGLAAGAATVGCCAQMVGFAVVSFRENGVGGLISQGIGTSMLQFGNIVRRPQIWLAPTLAGAVLGPVATCVVGMRNTAYGAGMGTSGLVGQFGTFAAMPDVAPPVLAVLVLLLHFVAPALLSLLFDAFFRKIGWVKAGDMKLSV